MKNRLSISVLIIGIASLALLTLYKQNKPQVAIEVVSAKKDLTIGSYAPFTYKIINNGNTVYDQNQYVITLYAKIDPDAETSYVLKSFRKHIGARDTVEGVITWDVRTNALPKPEGNFWIELNLSQYDDKVKTGVTIASTTIPVTIINSLNNITGSIQLSKTTNITFSDDITITYEIHNTSGIEIGGKDTTIDIVERQRGMENTFSPIAALDVRAQPDEIIRGSIPWKIKSIPEDTDYEVVLRIVSDDPNDFITHKEFIQPITYMKVF